MKNFLFPAANILVAVFLLSVFFIASQNIVETFSVADMAALNNLQPQPADYFLELSARQAAPDRNKARCYADYYEHLLRVFPDLWDAYGMLGYCYHYLNDDPKAIKFFKIAIQNYPDYFWNYYNLAIIYIHESRYPEAFVLFQKALQAPPVTTLKRMFTSSRVYLPLIEPDEKKAFAYTSQHLKETYWSIFVMTQILRKTGDLQQAQAVMEKIRPELYAF